MSTPNCSVEIYRPLPEESAVAVAEFAARLADSNRRGLGPDARTLEWGPEPRVGLLRLYGLTAFNFYREYEEALKVVSDSGSNASAIRIEPVMGGFNLRSKSRGPLLDPDGKPREPMLTLKEDFYNPTQIPVGDADLWKLLRDGLSSTGCSPGAKVALDSEGMRKVPLTTLGNKAMMTVEEIQRIRRGRRFAAPSILLERVRVLYHEGEDDELDLNNYGYLP